MIRGYDLNNLRFISILLKDAEAVEKLYNELYNLELHGERNSEKFDKNLNFLHETLAVEVNDYNRLSLPTDTYIDAINFLYDQLGSRQNVSDIEVLISQQNDFLTIRRVLHNLKQKVMGEYDLYKPYVATSLVELLNAPVKIGINIYAYNPQNIYLYNFLHNYCMTKAMNIIDDKLSNDENMSNHKAEFLKFIYNCAFLNFSRDNGDALYNRLTSRYFLDLDFDLTANFMGKNIRNAEYIKENYILQSIDNNFDELIRSNESVDSVQSILRLTFFEIALLLTPNSIDSRKKYMQIYVNRNIAKINTENPNFKKVFAVLDDLGSQKKKSALYNDGNKKENK